MSEQKHTATPWAASGNGIHVGMRCVATTHAEPYEQRKVDAAFIVRAVNAHDDLVKIATLILRGIEGGHIQCASYFDFDPSAEQIEFKSPADMLRAALIKAGA
jgi:hypothetical protein